LEELARAGVHFGALIQSVVAHYILAYGRAEQKGDWLSRMARGELVGAIAMTEPAAGSDLPGIQTTARRDGDHYVINGSKTFITNGRHASIICLAVKTNPNVAGMRGISLLVVEPQSLPATASGARSTKSACTRRTLASSSSTTYAFRWRTCWALPKARDSPR